MSPRGWLGALALAAAPAIANAAQLELEATLDPESRLLRARAVLHMGAQAAEIALSARFEVESAALDGRRDALAGSLRGGRHVWRLPAATRERRVEIAYRGRLEPLDESLSHRDTLVEARPVAGARGSFLPGAALWHPMIAGELAGYRVTIDVPAGQRALVAGRLLEEEERAGRYRARFEFAHPAADIDLIAGPYRLESRQVRTAAGTPLRLRTYFHPEIAPLAAGYLDAAQGHLERYERWIGAYPYESFSIVSSPTPTGFGMPSLTYLGIDVLRLPFIRATSLGHEVLHNWWGNGVRVDLARGNWSEGLTTFMADYTFAEERGAAEAREMRLAWLRDFAALPPGEERPLAQFVARHHGASQIVGYHKAAMAFFMLRDLLGEAAFDAGLREFWRAQRFRAASWRDLQRAFEEAAQRDLSAFFAQWLERAGAPELRIAKAQAVPAGEGWRISATLEQAAPAYRLRVPVVVRTSRGRETHFAEMDGERADLVLETASRPAALELDPDLRVFRRLAPGEAPPILRQAMLDPATAVVIASGGEAARAARSLAARLLENGGKTEVAQTQLPEAPLLAIGLAADVDAWLAHNRLAPRPVEIGAQGSAQAWAASHRGGRALVVVSARDAEALAALVRPLPHYGRQSWIAFDGAKAISRGVWPSKPQVVRLD
ncbi:MAG TPA: M1 family aminopeptidase [Burkholderiales bacterium]